MSFSTLRNSPSPPPYSPITDPTITLPLPNSLPLSVPLSLNNSTSLTAVNSSSLALSHNSTTPSTSVHNASVPRSLIFHSPDRNSLEAFELNGQKFSSVDEIFDYINQQPAENRRTLTEKLLQYRNTVVRRFEGWDEQILERIQREKAWEFVDLDKTTLKTHLYGLKSAVNHAQAEKNRESRNRKKIEDSWGSEVLSLLRTSSRSELVEVVKAVRKFPVYQDARNRINLLIIQRLTDKTANPHLKRSLHDLEIG